MNIFSATGRLGSDAQVRQAGSSSVASMSIAVDVGYGDKKSTLWVRGNMWGKRAEGGLIQYLTKGASVAVSGELSNREWTDKDGQTKQSLELNISTIDLIGGRQQSNSSGSGSGYGDSFQEGSDMGEESVPF